MAFLFYKGGLPEIAEAKPQDSKKSCMLSYRGKLFWGEQQGTQIHLALDEKTLTDAVIELADAEEVIPAQADFDEYRRVKAFDLVIPTEIKAHKAVAITDGENDGIVTDYQDVVIQGLASTFKNVTPADRDGDYVEPDAFAETIAAFMRNPVMLIDHKNSVREIAGSFAAIQQTALGLEVIGRISNSPEMRHVRFLAVEGHLKAFSIGGLFYFGPDGHSIQRVKLFEISLVAVPANPDTLFRVRSLSPTEILRLN